MIDYQYMDLFLQDSIHHDIIMTDGTVSVSGTSYTVSGQTVVIDNSLIDGENVDLNQSLCSSSQLEFGACEAASLEFTIYDNIPTLKGKTLKVYIFPDRDASKLLQIGVFKVEEDELTSDRKKRNITAYDALYDIINSDVASWYNTLLPNTSTSLTLAQFRASLMTHFGITAESATLVNDSMTVKRTIAPDSLSGGDVIRAICELNGCFGTITNEGKFRFVELSAGIDDGLFPSDTLYPADDLYPQDTNPYVTPMPKSHYITVEFKDFDSESITQLVIRTDDADVGTQVGTSGNTYVIQDNFLVYGKNATELTTIGTNALSKMTNRYYKPCTVDCVGNPCHEVGDPIRIATKYRGVVTYILERHLSGVQALRDEYSAQGMQKYNEQLNFKGTQVKKLANKSAQLKFDTDGLQTYVEEQLDTSVVGSYANITAGQIALKVSKTNLVDDLDDEMTGIDITSNRIDITSSGVFTVDATNFKLTDDGTATLNGANFTTSDTNKYVNISDGKIKVASSSSDSNYLEISTRVATGGIYIPQIYMSKGNTTLWIDGDYGFRMTSLSGEVKVMPAEIRITTSATDGIYINSNPVLTSASTIGIGQLSGQIDRNTNVTFGKYITAVGTSDTYDLKLQTISINGTNYVMYAYSP